jgi:hypothetical protein
LKSDNGELDELLLSKPKDELLLLVKKLLPLKLCPSSKSTKAGIANAIQKARRQSKIPSGSPAKKKSKPTDYINELVTYMISGNSKSDEAKVVASVISGKDKSDAATKSSTAIKSSIGTDKQKLAAKPSTTSVVVELTEKEKRAKNKKIQAEVLQKCLRLRLCWVCLLPLVRSIGK